MLLAPTDGIDVLEPPEYLSTQRHHALEYSSKPRHWSKAARCCIILGARGNAHVPNLRT
jgi:hypothetical protein